MSWFTTKKVKGSDTLSEKLIEIRTAQKIDLDNLADKTKITKKYLVYLEDGRLDKMPAEIYVKDFLKKIADFYGVDVKGFLRLYKKEECIRRNIDKNNHSSINLNYAPTFIITPRTITALAVSIILVSFVVFFGYQVSAIFKGPELLIDFPTDELVVDFTPVLVKGSVGDPDSVVYINGEAIGLKDGKILEEISLTPGSNIIKISATNRFKKISEITRTVVLKAENKKAAETNLLYQYKQTQALIK
ncbi:MAG: helix-turn-helix domain-containing protein [bacterium]|nr:helix-turn-helix domain-containing protein [bacterium]